MLRIAMIGLAFLTLPNYANAEDVYEKIGSQLDKINSTLNSGEAHNGYENALASKIMAIGSVDEHSPTALYKSPMPTGVSNLKLNPGSPVRIIGDEGNYWAVIPDGFATKDPLYVPKSNINVASGQTIVGGVMSKAISQVRELKDVIAGSGVNIKGFSVTLGVPPSVDIEFEISK